MRFSQSNFVCVLLAVGVLALSGCSITKENDAAADASVKSAQDLFDDNQVQKKSSLISRSDALYLSDEVFEITNDVQLPAAFSKRVVYTTGVNESVVNTYGNIAKLAGQEVFVSDGARVVIDEAGGMLSLGVASYQGTFLQVLNQISNKYGLFWQYDEKKKNINIFAIETQVYELDAPLGAFKINNTVNSTSEASGENSGSSSSGGSTSIGGSSQMNLAYDVEAQSPWSASVNTITNMLSARGSITDNPVEGYVTVTDNPNVQEKIAGYIKKINVKNNKKIAIRIDVYDVETSQTSDYGLDVNALVDVLGDEVNIVSNSSSIFNQSTDNMSSVTFSSGSGSDHNAVFNALNTLGKTSEVTGATIYTISGQPAPIQSVLQTTYLESSTTTINDNGDNTTTLEPGTVVTGYSMTVTPKIQSNNQILVNLNLQLSTLLDMAVLSSTEGTEGGETIQGPEIHSKNFLENMVLESGQSLLIAGFQEKTIKSVTASPGSISNWVAGGSRSTANTVTTTVIVVTPYVIGD